MASLLALGAALSWGAGDFLGGLATRRVGVLTVLALSQAIGLLGMLLWVVVAHDAFTGVPELLPAAAAGVSGVVGLAALYRGFAVGAMGIVAPISAAGPLLPLAVDAALRDHAGRTPVGWNPLCTRRRRDALTRAGSARRRAACRRSRARRRRRARVRRLHRGDRRRI